MSSTPTKPAPTTLGFSNFKGLGDFEFTFDEQLTVLVGPNGVGKSSVLQGAALLGRLDDSSLNAHDADTLARGWVGDSQQLEELLGDQKRNSLALSMKRGAGTLRAEFTVAKAKTWAPGLKLVLADASGQFSLESGKAKSDVFPVHRLRPFRSRYFHFDAEALARPAQASTDAPDLAKDGTGLAAVVSWLASTERRLDTIEELLRKVVRGVKQVRVRPVPIAADVGAHTTRNAGGHLLELSFDGVEHWVPAQQVSEGTLLTLALLTSLYTPGRADLLLIDDIDRALHPRAQRELIGSLRQLLLREEFSEVRILCTSHSPYLLDNFEEPEVVVLSRKDGRVLSKRLKDHPDWERFKSTMSPGEFWSSVGEDWIFGSG